MLKLRSMVLQLVAEHLTSPNTFPLHFLLLDFCRENSLWVVYKTQLAFWRQLGCARLRLARQTFLFQSSDHQLAIEIAMNVCDLCCQVSVSGFCGTGSTWISSLHCWGRLHGGQQDQHMALISKQLQQSPFQIVKGFLTMVVVCSKQNLPQSVIFIHIKIERLYKHTWCSILWVGDQ